MTRPHPALPRVFANQTAWLTTLATDGQAVWQQNGITACINPGHLHLLIPAGTNPAPGDLAAAFDWLRQSGVAPLLIWTDRDDTVLDRAIRHHGGGESWKPHWMMRDLTRPFAPLPLPGGIVIERGTRADLPALASKQDVPYANTEELRRICAPQQAETMWWFVARTLDTREPVGHITAFLAQDGSQWAGLYNAGVRPRWQRRGIGSALTAIACRAARDAGASVISLNATPQGERVYRKLGFETIGDGQTWFMRFS